MLDGTFTECILNLKRHKSITIDALSVLGCCCIVQLVRIVVPVDQSNQIKRTTTTMSSSSDSDSVHTDFLTCPASDESAPIDPEIPDQSEEGGPASPLKRGRKQPKPKKKQSANDRILEEIQILQQSTDTIIPKAAFQRFV